jgi:hypothetical protein
MSVTQKHKGSPPNQNLLNSTVPYPQQEGGRIPFKRIQDDDRARMSFAIMGVLILILGSASTVYLVSVNRDSL